MNILIENASIVPMDGGARDFFTGSVGIAGNRIEMVTDDAARVARFKEQYSGDGLRVIDGSGKIVIPGLINTHNHAPMSLMRGYADDIPLMEWLNDHIWPMEERLTRDLIILGAKLAIAEMLLGGTTTFVDMYWQEEAIGDAAVETGIRAVLAPTMIDFKTDDFGRDIEAIAAKFGAGQHPRITFQIAAHSPYAVSEDNLRQVVALAEKYDVGINIHLAETLDECRQISERYSKTPTQFVSDLGLLGPRTLANHCVHMNDKDIELFAASGASVAHCPQSNMKLGNGAAPVVAMRAAGINVSLGTDGPCSNNDLDMIEELRTAAFLQKNASADSLALPAIEALKLATVCGAKAIGKESQLGRIVEGYIADIVIMDGRKPHLFPMKDIVANIVYASKAADVDTVIVDGRVVVEGGRLLTMDVDALLDDVQRNMF